MTVHIQLQPGALLAQRTTMAGKCPVHKRMSSVTTDITTTVARAA
jgi:hypothetical protein